MSQQYHMIVYVHDQGWPPELDTGAHIVQGQFYHLPIGVATFLEAQEPKELPFGALALDALLQSC